MPHRKVGTHRRIRMEEVMTYKTGGDRERKRSSKNSPAWRRSQGTGIYGHSATNRIGTVRSALRSA